MSFYLRGGVGLRNWMVLSLYLNHFRGPVKWWPALGLRRKKSVSEDEKKLVYVNREKIVWTLVFPKEEKFSVRKFQLELLEEGLPTLKACAGKWFFFLQLSKLHSTSWTLRLTSFRSVQKILWMTYSTL